MGSGFRLAGVGVENGSTVLLDAISVELPAEQCTAVVGPSGAGKSTLARLLNRLAEPTSGGIELDGVPLPELDVLELRRRVGLVGQRPVLLADTVAEEVRVGRADLPDARVAELLTHVGLPERFAERRGSELSGGEAQRVCLARALAVEPEVLVLDEPTSALDAALTTVISDLIRDHVAAAGTVVLISHDHSLVRHTADHVLVLEQGRLVASGVADEIDYLEAQ